MSALVVASYGDLPVSFTDAGWFNATTVAAKYGKRPVDWLRSTDARQYIEAVCAEQKVQKSHLLSKRLGRNGGTWFHPKLAVAFARWLDVRFAVWCDQQIENILRGRNDGLWGRRLSIECRDTASAAKAAAGAKFMSERRWLLRSIRSERAALSAAMEPPLFPELESTTQEYQTQK